MWKATAEVDRARVLDADMERAGEFLRTAGPWALMPGASYAFKIPGSPAGLGQLICLVGAPPDGVAGGILEVVDETPGQMVRVRSRSTNPVGKQVVTLSVEPHRGRPRARLGLRVACGLAERTSVENAWRNRLDAWLSALAGTLEGRTSWPSDEKSAGVLHAWRDGSGLTDHETVGVEAVIRASPGPVWQAVRSPETRRRVLRAVCGGYVPGTPEHQVGEMVCYVLPRPQDQLVATISVVADVAEEQSVLMRRVGRPSSETLTTLRPADDGTHMTLARRIPSGSTSEVLQEVAADLRSRVNAYKELLEQPA